MAQLTSDLPALIHELWERRNALPDVSTARTVIAAVFRALEDGIVRAAIPQSDGTYRNEPWIKQAILLHFKLTPSEAISAGALDFYDKVATQTDWEKKSVRVVPPAVVRIGAYIGPGCILMPSFVNVGAFVGSGTMVDTWATVGSCAQIGANCHLSGGVGIGGVLEPLQANPVIIGDRCFIGARSEIAEGVIVGEEAVLAMGCYVSASTRIYDATTGQQRERGIIPPRAVVVPGSLPSADGSHSTYALIIKKYRDAGTDAKTALNDVLR